MGNKTCIIIRFLSSIGTRGGRRPSGDRLRPLGILDRPSGRENPDKTLLIIDTYSISDLSNLLLL